MKPLSCASARRRLQAFHDRELAVPDQIAVSAHLEWCDQCAATLAEIGEVRSMLQPRRQLLLGEQAVRRGLPIRTELAMGGDVLIERHLIRAMTPPPEPVAVARLIDGNAIDPGAEARLAAETLDRTENAQEDLL